MAVTRPTHEAAATQRLRRDGRDGDSVDESFVGYRRKRGALDGVSWV